MLLLALPRITLWHMLPIALGLHGLVFVIPAPSPTSTEAASKPQTESVNLVELPKPPNAIKPPAKPTAKPQPTPKAKPSVIAPRKVEQVIAASPNPQPVVVPSVSATPTPTPTPTPSTAPTPTPTPTDALQIVGATPGCNGREGCWQLAESKGRMVAGTIEQQLQKQGYRLTQKDLDEDTGFRVYEVAKDGVRQYYLHLIWSDRGTAYVRNPDLMSRSELATVTGL